MATGVGPPGAKRCEDEALEQEQPPIRPPRTTRQPHRVGYDCDFLERPPKAFQSECPVCLLVLREPHQVTCCGYSFCAACVKRVQKDKKCCPTCNEADFIIFPDKRLKRSLNEYRVYCCQRREGCEWEGELGELDRHLNLQPPPEKLLVGCQFSEVDCTYCIQPFQRRYVRAHQSDDCPKRPYVCEHCNKNANTFKATFEEVSLNHWPVCPFFPLSCPNNCELVLQRQEVEHHVSQDCPFTLVLCDFSMVGCEVQLARRDMPSHVSENLTGHMSLLQVHMMTHPEVNMATHLWLMVGSIQKIVVENANIRSELHEAKEKLRGTHERVAQLEALGIPQQEHNENLQQEVEVCREETKVLKQYKDDLTEKLTASEQKIQALDTQLDAISDEKEQLHCKLEECFIQLQQHQHGVTYLEKTVISQDEMIAMQAKKLEECSTQLEQHQQNTTLVHRDLQEMIQQTNTQLQATVTAHKKETAAALNQHAREGDKKLRATQEEQSTKLTASECKMQTALNAQQATLTQQKHELAKLSASELKLLATLATQQTTITKCRDENRRLQQSLTEQERKQIESEAKLTTVKDDLTRKITASEQKIKTQEATLNQHQKTLEKVTYTGTLPFEFTMTDFEQHKSASDVFYSPPFYTHTHGYRMCIRVDANGNRLGKGTHTSVYGYLMRGVFDDDLQWPFQGAITIQLLNQLEDSKHHTYTIDFTETTDPQYIRVTSGERAISGWGRNTFISHTQLDLNTSRNCQFLKDNQLKFRVSKATNLDPTAPIRRRCLTLESFARTIEPQVCVAPIEFALSDFEQQKKQNDVWLSPAFYTHPQGYRMCLQVYPNGFGDGLGTHVSICTCIMHGPFDGSLKWPFRGAVTIQIVNQAGEDNHQEEVMDYADKKLDMYGGRVTDKERSSATGFEQFLPHSSLGRNDARNTQYLRGDSLRIRISKVELKN